MASERGMALVGERAKALLAEVAAAPAAQAAAPPYADGLTERKVDVLRFVARGLTKKEIGDKLFILVKTVNTHMQHILEKTGMANRAEATAYAIRNGITEEPDVARPTVRRRFSRFTTSRCLRRASSSA